MCRTVHGVVEVSVCARVCVYVCVSLMCIVWTLVCVCVFINVLMCTRMNPHTDDCTCIAQHNSAGV